MQYAGLKIYNRWLAEACSVAPERLIGCVNIPFWDVDESIKVSRWARESGLHAVSFPAPRRGTPFYDDPVWEPFWSACEDLGMVLSTHAGFIDRDEMATPGPHEVFLRSIEAGGWPSRRAIHRLIFGGFSSGTLGSSWCWPSRWTTGGRPRFASSILLTRPTAG
jgi:hypothetical protein